MRLDNNEAAKGWDDLCRQLPANTRWAWEQMTTNPAPTVPNPRHSQLKYKLAEATRKGFKNPLPQWQLEVGNGARIWYLYDKPGETCWIQYAGCAHPKATD